MPLTSIIILGAIVCAFTTFGAVLAWGDYRTRGLVRAPRLQDPERIQTTAPARAGVDANAERSREFGTV